MKFDTKPAAQAWLAQHGYKADPFDRRHWIRNVVQIEAEIYDIPEDGCEVVFHEIEVRP